MVSRLRTAAVLAFVALALAACSSDSTPTPAPSASASASGSAGPSASPTPGTLVGRDAFAVTVPDGWVEQPDAGGALLLAVSDEAVDGYPTNVNVVEDPTLAQVAPEQLEEVRQAPLTASGATQIKAVGDYEVDGDQGVQITYEQNVRAIAVRSDEVTVTHGDTGYIVSFSFSPSVSRDDRDAVIASVMDTWTWAQ